MHCQNKFNHVERKKKMQRKVENMKNPCNLEQRKNWIYVTDENDVVHMQVNKFVLEEDECVQEMKNELRKYILNDLRYRL